MTVKELTDLLNKFSPDTEVLISDGHRRVFYRGNYVVDSWVTDGVEYCDIGIGGTDDYDYSE